MSEPARRLLSRLCLAAALVALGAVTITPAAAQVLYGSIVGNVTDAQGAAIPGVAVTVVNKETNLTREATTNAEGNYSLVNLLPGRYDVKISLQGFREALRANVPVTIGQLSRVDASLEIGALTETVTVQSQAELLQTDSAEVSTQLKSTEITAMPLNRFRNYQALVTLSPGTTPMQFQNAETDTPARSLATNVNGQAINSNATRTDGATNVNIWLPSHNMYVSPAETVDTVNISTNNFDAEQGMAGGSAITVITKSGTNTIRGSAFGFFNNDAMNATPYYFGGPLASGDPKPPKLPVERNIFGGTVGGPIRRDKLFYFGSYEGYRSEQSLFTFFSVPDAALRAGDFSRALNTNGSQQVIFDPATGNPDGSGRVPFAGNVIPANRINPIALQILRDLIPLPNNPGTGAGGLTQNFRRQENRTTDRDNFDVKMNWNRTASHQVWWKVSYMDAVVDDLTNYMGPPTDAEGDGGLTKVWQLTTGHTWTLGPTMIMDGTFGFSRQDQDVLGPDFQAGFYGLDTLGIPGTNDPVDRDPRYAGYPRFDAGFTPEWGNRDGWNPIFRDERTYSFATNLTKLAGGHELRGGYMVNFLYLDHWQPESDNPRGRFNFTTRSTTALRGGSQTANFYNHYAAFLLGLPGTVSKSIQNEEMTGREWQHGLFFRDRWTVSPKLTLDLGVRWEYYPIMGRADRGMERVDLDTLEVILGGVGGNPTNVGLEPGKDNFAPRLGAIYRLNDDTVIRSGFGVTYNPVPWARVLRGDNAYPITIPFSFFNSEPFQPFGNISQGLPVVTGPAPSSTGRVPLPTSVTVWTAEPGNIDRGTIKTWNLAFERRLPLDISADIAYVGARGDGGYAAIDINQPATIGSGDAGRRYSSRGRVNQLLSFGQHLETRYHSMQLAVNRPFTNGLLLKGAYTLSKSMNNASGGGADQDGRVTFNWNHPSQFDRNYALAGFDRTHNLQLGFLYQLWQSNGGYGNIGKAILSDWQLNGVFGAWSGQPFTVTANGAVVNTPNNQQTADLVGEIRKTGNIGSAGTYYDTSAWAQPQGVRFGNTGRNSVRGPGAWNLDLGLFRAFPMGAARRLEFRVDAINVTNTPKFANPNGDVNSGNFMRITSIANSNGVAHYPEREIRIGLRFSF